MNQLIGVLVCLSPLLFVAIGYYVGRYGSPIIIRRQARQDRRQLVTETEPESVDIYRYNGTEAREP